MNAKGIIVDKESGDILSRATIFVSDSDGNPVENSKVKSELKWKIRYLKNEGVFQTGAGWETKYNYYIIKMRK